jgi:ribonuclease J
VAEVGKNMFLLEYEEDIIVVDCGVSFPQEDQLGIDLVLPDISYLRERADKIRAIFITHGHEDHIGALPFHLADINAPVYSTKLTLGLIAVKLEDAKLRDRVDLRELNPESVEAIQAGAFSVEPFRVCHSIPDAVGFGITRNA